MEVNPVYIGIIGFVLFLILLFLEMPVGICLAIVGFCGVWVLSGLDQAAMVVMTVPYRIGSTYVWSLIPLFILMGLVAYQSGIGLDLYEAFSTWFGRFPGGLAITTIAAAAAFGSVCGDNIAAGVTMTSVCLPEMRKYKYHDTLSLASICAGGLLSFLIPPSLGFIIYGLITAESIGSLFLAGVIPGIMNAILFMVTIVILVRIDPLRAPKGPVATWKERFVSLRRLWGVVLLVFIIFGGMYSGFITPTEAGALGAFAAIVVGIVKRRLSWQKFKAAVFDATKTVGMVFVLFIGGYIFAPFLSLSTIPAELLRIMQGMPPGFILFFVCMIYIIGGCLMDTVVLMLITLPVLYPIVMVAGFDPIWFAVVMILLVNLGSLTPPVGLMVYIIAQMVPEISTWNLFKAVTPFVFAILICTIIIIIFPQLSTFLPQLLMPK